MVFFGTFIAMCNGAVLPFIGIFIGKMLYVLQPAPGTPLSEVRSGSNLYCLGMFLLCIGAFAFSFLQMVSFGIIGENVTLVMRKALYSSILSKNIGWFDSKDNSPGQLSSTMATEAQLINGVISGGIAAALQAFFSVSCGIAIGFAYNWKVSLVCLGCIPFMVISGIMNVKFQQGLTSASDDAMKEPNMLAGDSIINYRTVASFANEDQILKDYDRMLEGPVQVSSKKSHIIGFIFGFS
jgi:ABC-type multidrug transport system fused ATPase/permease subunit